MARVSTELAEYCGEMGIRPPSRTSIYNAIERAEPRRYRFEELPAEARESLYNLDPDPLSEDTPEQCIPGDQVVYYAFNYGSPRAISFAAGLPWLCLIRAFERPGWRPKSRALLRAVLRYRGL